MAKKEYYFIGFIIILTTVLLFLPTNFENPTLTDSLLYEKARVISIDNSSLSNISIVTLGTQRIVAKIETGKFKGDTVNATNVLLGQKKLDKIFEKNDEILSVIRLNDTKDNILEVKAADYYREDLEFVLFIAFACFLILFAKLTGFKAIISFIFTALTFWKLLIPAFLKGYSPLLVSTGVVFICSFVIILLVGGLTRKGFVALMGTFSGVIITAILAIGFGYLFKIPGTVKEYAEALLYSGFTDLDYSEMFISIIFVSSSGAIMDVSMDISAAQYELINKIPNLSMKELIKSGFRIASPTIGSMTTTLLFAYSGSFMFAFMAFMAKGVPFRSLVNTSYISAEILHTMVGSFGLVLVAPLTAVIGGLLYTKSKKL